MNEVIEYNVLDDDDEPKALIVAATCGDRFVGLAKATLDEESQTAHAVALVVQPDFRGCGYGHGLMIALQREAQARGMRAMHTTLESTQANGETVHHILSKLGWDEPLPGMVLARSNATHIADAGLLGVPLPEDAEVFLWGDLTEAEQIALSDESNSKAWFPVALAPFPDKPVEPTTSVGVRRNGQVVGWMLTHRTDEDTVMYSRLFIRREERRSMLALAVLGEAIRRQMAVGIPEGEFAVRVDNHPMLGFLDKYLGPHLTRRTEVRRLEKSL